MAFFWRRKKDEDKFSTSVLGLDKSIEQLQAQEAAVEREIGIRFTKAIAKTRDSINNKLDTIFENRKQIDEAFLDELEEMLISTDIGVSTTLQILDSIRRGVSRAGNPRSRRAQSVYETRAFDDSASFRRTRRSDRKRRLI